MSHAPSREETLFADALALPPGERGAFLAQACGANVDLLAHLVALVAAHEGPESLVSPASPADLSAAAVAKSEEKPGDAIGRYSVILLQKLIRRHRIGFAGGALLIVTLRNRTVALIAPRSGTGFPARVDRTNFATEFTGSKARATPKNPPRSWRHVARYFALGVLPP